MTIDIEKLAKEHCHYQQSNDQFSVTLYGLKQICEAYAAKVLEDKEREIAELKAQKVRHDQLVDYLKAGIAEELEQTIVELQADNNRLREALEFYAQGKNYTEGLEMFGAQIHLKDYGQVARQALSKTPAQSLQEHDNELIERCAKVCDNHWTNIDCKVAISALKCEV